MCSPSPSDLSVYYECCYKCPALFFTCLILAYSRKTLHHESIKILVQHVWHVASFKPRLNSHAVAGTAGSAMHDHQLINKRMLVPKLTCLKRDSKIDQVISLGCSDLKLDAILKAEPPFLLLIQEDKRRLCLQVVYYRATRKTMNT